MEIYETESEIAKRKSWLLSLVVIVLVGLGVLVVLQVIALADRSRRYAFQWAVSLLELSIGSSGGFFWPRDLDARNGDPVNGDD